MPDPHISAAAQADIAHVLQWSFDHFGADAEARYAALIATAIRHAADSRDSPGFKRRTELPGEIVSWHLSQSVRQTGADRVRRPRHLLVCRWVGDQLQIARLLHEAQDPSLNFDADTDWG